MRLIAILLLLLPVELFADRIVLKNGKEYRGTFIMDSDAGRIRFRISPRVVRNFPASGIARLEIGNQPAPDIPRTSPAGEADRELPPRTPAATQPAQPASGVPAGHPPPRPFVTAPEFGTAATSPVAGAGAVDSEYTRMGSEAGPLGPPRAPHQATADGRASVRFYASGAIYWTREAGAHAMKGPILQAWLAQGGEQSRLGYPTGDEEVDDAGFSRQQQFEHGTITWTQTDGATVQY